MPKMQTVVLGVRCRLEPGTSCLSSVMSSWRTAAGIPDIGFTLSARLGLSVRYALDFSDERNSWHDHAGEPVVISYEQIATRRGSTS